MPGLTGEPGESHLRTAVHEYMAHYRMERNHQGLGGQLIVSPANLNRVMYEKSIDAFYAPCRR